MDETNETNEISSVIENAQRVVIREHGVLKTKIEQAIIQFKKETEYEVFGVEILENEVYVNVAGWIKKPKDDIICTECQRSWPGLYAYRHCGFCGGIIKKV